MIFLNNITKKYGDKIIFEKRKIQIKKGHFVAIIGRSGSGKSSLLNIMGMLDEDFEGEYFYEDRNIHEISNNKKAFIRNNEIGFVFQCYNLIEDLNVIDNIMLPYCYSQKKFSEEVEDMIKKIIKDLKIDDIEKVKVKHLSGGEKQRVGIARAIVMNPKLILADEPTGNLDLENTRIVMDYFNKLKKNKTIVMVTHDLSIINECDKIIDLEDDNF